MNQTDKERRAILKSVAAQLTNEPQMAYRTGNLARRFSATSTNSVVRINNLAWALYVQHKPELALQLCSVLQGLPDATESVRWFAIESTLCLAWKLHTQAEQLMQAQLYVNSIRASYTTAWMKEREHRLPFLALESRLLGSMMYDAASAEKTQAGYGPTLDEGMFYAQRAKEIIFIQMFGGSDVWSSSALDHELLSSLDRIRATRYYDRILS